MPTLPQRAVLAFLLLAAGVGAGSALAVDAARPLAERVTIRRDTFGAPHIAGETEAAAALGFGYAQAEDHAEEMARRFLAATGEAARHFGPTFLDSDLAARRVDNVGEARRAMATLDGTFRDVLAGFAEGFNLYVRQNRAALPSWVREISAVDALVATRSEAAVSAASPALERSLRQKYPDGAKAIPPTLPVQAVLADATLADATLTDEGDGSNALAISGRRTTSGKPILLGNPHLRWQQLYWEAHITVPRRLDFYGSTLVGLPWLRAGFNDRLAYVQTNNAPDNADVFALPIDPAAPNSYRFDGKTWPLTKLDVSVDVKQDDGTIKAERRSYWRSHLGPIVYRNAATAFAYRSTALDAWRFFESFWRLSHARSLAEYRRVLAMRLAPTSNYTYADADGNILYYWNARVPRRLDDGTKYDLDVPGEPKYLWRKLHAASDLPQLLNPAGGYIQNANNPPWFASASTPLDPSRCPSYFERGELALRPQLALSMLEARPAFSVEDVLQLKFDTRLLLAERVRPALVAAIVSQATPSEELTRARTILESWDGRASADSRGAVLFQRFWSEYRREVRQPFAEQWEASRPTDTPRGLAAPDVALKHLAAAVTWTASTYGAADVAWGTVNRYRFGDIDLPGEGASGQLGAYRVQQFDPVAASRHVSISGWAEKDRQLAGFGDGWILLVHFAQPVKAMSVLAYGQTTDRASLHSRDQIRIFANRNLRPVFYTAAEIRAHLEREYRPHR